MPRINKPKDEHFKRNLILGYVFAGFLFGLAFALMIYLTVSQA